ncbi:hypothetical protein ATCC90586_008302 [Pythium insidiosum]|nr:hypothetical protein ATCC90586_008302 [Pythium insidiosum]
MASANGLRRSAGGSNNGAGTALPSWVGVVVNETTAGNSSTVSPTPGDRGDGELRVAYYIYIFLGAMFAVALGSLLIYCYHQRRIQRFVEHDNMNNNMQRHSLVDSFIENGEVEWQCSVCYHENHPAKHECLMCGTPQIISQQALASPPSVTKSGGVASFANSSEEQTLQAARTRSFHVRRLNELNLTQRQRGARRRNLWRREKTEDGQFRWPRRT